MKLTDWLGEDGVWLHVNSDHHVMALDRQGRRRTSTTSPSTSSTSARCASRSTTSAGTAAGWAGDRPGTASAATSPPTCGSSRRSASSSCTATWSSCSPTTSRAAGRMTASPPTPGARCRRAPTSASTRRRSNRSARASRCSESRCSAPRADGGDRMTLQGYTVPRTPSGAASLVPPPPWHYVGDFLVVDFHADPEAAASLLPEGLEPHPDAGRCAAVFVDWQSFSEGGDELLDPVRSQYREFYLVVSGAARRRAGHDLPVHLGRPGLRDGARMDPGLPQEARRGLDDAHLRPRLQGLARRRRGLALRRHLLRPRPPARARDADARAARARPGSLHTDPPLVNVRHFPRLAAGRHDDPQVHELVRARSRDRSVSEIWEGDADARAVRGPRRGAHAAGADRTSRRGYRFTFAYTVDDLETVKEYAR